MASVSVPVNKSIDDGYQTWDNRSNASGLDTTTALKFPVIGPHFSGANRHAAFFIFKLENIPKHSIITDCKISLRTNNDYPAASGSDHIYIAVENNMDPSGTGLPTNGMLGTLPYQRLGRQSAATTLYGNRCGPTHNKPGETLASYGAHVRDANALIYKAFCLDQANGAEPGRGLPLQNWVYTENFAKALQPMLEDPAWNEDTQYVMVWLFSDNQSGTDFNIGSLSGHTWNNGTVGATSSYVNGVGQYYTYDYNAGQYAPRLDITYFHSSLKSSNTKSIGSGFVRLTPAVCLGRMMGERCEYISGGAIVPKINAGAHDLPFTGMQSFNPNDFVNLWSDGNPAGSRVKWGFTRPGRVNGRSILLEDYVTGDYALKIPQIWWDINYWQKDYTSRDVYSMRFYHRYDQEAWASIFQNVVSFQYLGAEVFRIEHKDLSAMLPNPATQMELRILWTGNGSPWTVYQFKPPNNDGFYRYEIQVDANANPKVRVRVYLNDNIVPLEVLTANPPSVEIDRIMIGDKNTDSVVLNSKVSDIEIWSDYTLNRQFPNDINNTVGTPYKPQKWQWFEYDGGNASGYLEDLGTISSIDGFGSNIVMTSPTDALTLEDIKAEIWTGGVDPFVKYSDLQYGVGVDRRLNLYVPLGTPPTGGWPVVMYTHGGFWTSGSKSDISRAFVDHCTINGYAVASCDYTKNAMVMQYLNQSYPPWNPSTPSGRYPSVIINYKEATYWLQSVAASTYSLNPAKFIASGHSAGAYNALGAAVSRGLTNDGGGRNLTLAGNTAIFGSPNVPDPEFLAAYVLAAPVSPNLLIEYDPTYPNWKFLGTDKGVMAATFRAFTGNTMDAGPVMPNMDYYGIDDMIIANATNVVPNICYAWSPHDFLVVSNRITAYSQEKAFADALNSVSGSLPSGFKYESHSVPDALHHTIHDVDFDFTHFVKWLKSL